MKAGRGCIGDDVQRDMVAVLSHLIAEGHIDKDRIGIMGASYFGFAALLALYKGWGYCRFHEPLQGIMVPHPRSYEFPYEVYFAHKGNALVSPKNTIIPSNIRQMMIVLAEMFG